MHEVFLLMPHMDLSKDKLKFIKGAFLKRQDGNIIIQHYETDIFTMNEQTKIATIKKDCSMTSNRMIHRAEYFYEPKEVIIQQMDKWTYSGGFVN